MFVGSTLLELDLSHNALVALEVERHTYLQTVDLSHNQVGGGHTSFAQTSVV